MADQNLGNKPVLRQIDPIKQALDWKAASDQRIRFMFVHSDGVVQELDLKMVSNRTFRRIDEECRYEVPVAPKEVPRVKDGGVDYNSREWETWSRSDAYRAYIKEREEKEWRRRVLFIHEVLPFGIPGDTFEQKSEWLSERPHGDVEKLFEFAFFHCANMQVEFRSRYDFFSPTDSQQNSGTSSPQNPA